MSAPVINTRVLVNDFEYILASSLDEVLALLDKHGEDAKVLAGGTDLVIQMKLGRRAPRLVVDISKLEELKQLDVGETIRIGAGRRYIDVLRFLRELGRYHGLAEAIEGIGKIQVLAVGTVGGNLGNGSPAADTAPPLLTYDARVRVMSAHAERVIPLREFYTGPGATVMAPNEIMIGVEFDAFPDGRAGAFQKIARVACDISKLTCAVAVQRDGETCTHCRVALGAVAPTPVRAHAVEAALEGRQIDAHVVSECAALVDEDISPINDIRCGELYRREAAGVLFRDAFATAWERARC
jgi:CO/xanthine dehydrogenase FAD-binding subunit